MSQSSFIAAALIAGFVLFLAAQDRLSTYAAVLWGATAAPPPAVPSGKSGGGSSVGSILGVGKTLGTVLGIGGF